MSHLFSALVWFEALQKLKENHIFLIIARKNIWQSQDKMIGVKESKCTGETVGSNEWDMGEEKL